MSIHTVGVQDQYYVFNWNGVWWVEMFYADSRGNHHVSAPTPYFAPTTVEKVIYKLQKLHPDAFVDELILTEEIADAKLFANAW